MNDMIDWWVNLNPLTEEEKMSLNQYRLEEKIFESDEVYDNLVQEYFNRMPYCNLTSKDYTITIHNSGTDFINELFDRMVDDETLIIYSDAEHPNVLKKVSEYKNQLKLHFDDDILKLNTSKIINESKKYKKVFLYIIGTQISSGIVTPQIFFTKLKQFFISHNIEHTFVLDDVHGMFFVPRDYSIFDYILYTCHANISSYDMGLLISRNSDFGEKIYNQLYQYFNMINIVLKRKDKIFLFYDVMREFFSPYLATDNFDLVTNNTHHLFAIKTNNLLYNSKIHDILGKLYIRLEGFDNNINYILIRNGRFIKNPEHLKKGLQLLEEYIPILLKNPLN